jgi:exosortase
MSASESFSPSEPLGNQPSATSPMDAPAAAARPAAISPLQIAAFVAPLLLVGWLYWGTVQDLIEVWDNDPNYSHGFVVPLFALLLGAIAYMRDGIFPVGGTVTRASAIWGGIEIAAGFLLHIFALFLGGSKLGLFIDVAALIFILRGVVLALGGPVANATYGFPLLFLIFMAPIPPQVYEPIALKMQALAAMVAANLLELVGVPVLREGYVIQIPGHTMEVAGECSGMRSLTAILALAMAIGYITGRGQVYRWTLGLLSAPVAIGVNCLRVFGTGLIMLYIGPEWASGKAHEYEGQVMVGFAALLLVGVAWLLAMIEDVYFKKPATDAAQVDPADPYAATAEPAAPT